MIRIYEQKGLMSSTRRADWLYFLINTFFSAVEKEMGKSTLPICYSVNVARRFPEKSFSWTRK